MRLCVITTENDRFTHEDIAKFSIEGGADCVQLRKKGATTKELCELTVEISRITKGKAKLIVNDRLDVALACGADGVHLGREDLPVKRAREVCGENLIIGASVSSSGEALRAWDDGADYLGAGPIFATRNKSEESPIGLSELNHICEGVEIPVIAIGGIDRRNIEYVMRAGASGAAVISAVSDSDDPIGSIRALIRLMD